MSVFSCCEYIYELYLNDSDPREHEVLVVLHIVELVLASLFTFDWLLSFFMADHKLIFCTRLGRGGEGSGCMHACVCT